MKVSPELENILRKVVGYFDSDVLAAYRDRPHQYGVETDDFWGRVENREASTPDVPYVCAEFGFRLRLNGDWALAVWLPDLKKSDPVVIERWRSFALPESELTPLEDDMRFARWAERYVEGSWAVPNGPLQRIRETLGAINNLCVVGVGNPLFKSKDAVGLEFPTGQNDHV